MQGTYCITIVDRYEEVVEERYEVIGKLIKNMFDFFVRFDHEGFWIRYGGL
jgi:hypothetical protein